MKGFIFFLVVCAYALGTIGGIGYALYGRAYLISLAIAAGGAFAFPFVKKCYREAFPEITPKTQGRK